MDTHSFRQILLTNFRENVEAIRKQEPERTLLGYWSQRKVLSAGQGHG